MNDTHKTTEYTASVREYINSLSENELIEYGHNEFDGKDQMFAALDPIDSWPPTTKKKLAWPSELP